MNTRSTCGVIAALFFVVGLIIAAKHSQYVLEHGLPGRVVYSSQAEAWTSARQNLVGDVLPVVGTGSMAPFIPAARPGLDAQTTVVAYAHLKPGAHWQDVKAGTLCVYRAPWDPRLFVIHQAAEHDGDGWIMSGLHNAHSEAAWRMTTANFVGIVDRIYMWRQ